MFVFVGWCLVVLGCVLLCLVVLHCLTLFLFVLSAVVSSCFKVFRCLNNLVFNLIFVVLVVLGCFDLLCVVFRLCQFVLRLFKVVSRIFCRTHS